MAGGFSDEPDCSLPTFAVGSTVAQYRLEERIGTGGMAVVFRAWDQRLDRWVALKVLAPALAADEVFRRRFLREARAAAAVDDPHIIPVFEAGEAAGTLFIAMRYVAGGDARSLARRTASLSWRRAAAIVSSAASALDTAHAAGLVHRDVKPANILVDVRPGRPDHVYLSDFGLCRGTLFWSGPSGQGQFLGTLGYAAPEQLEGKPVDGRTDQYSLACSAFELLSGAPPFPRQEPGAVIWAHLSEPPPLLTSRCPRLPVAAGEVLARALAKDPEARYASCREFASALRAALEPAPSSGAPVIDLASERCQDETTWPSIAEAGYGESVSAPKPPGLATQAPKLHHARARPARYRRELLRLSVMYAAMFVAVLSILSAGAQFDFSWINGSTSTPVPLPSKTPLASGYYLGVYVAGPGYQPVARFGAAAGRHPNVVGIVSHWDQPFPASFAWSLCRHGAVPLVQIQPTDASVSGIASGDDDGYLRRYADSARDLGHQVVISFGEEMNASWHSWGYRHTSASAFVAAWRHIVTLFRNQGADNVTWLWTVQADQPGTGRIRSWWPGASYVTWVEIDGFYNRPSDAFSTVFAPTIDVVRARTDKPLLLSETGAVHNALQRSNILNLFNGIARYRLLGLVWSDPASLESNPAAEQAFRLGVTRLKLVR